MVWSIVEQNSSWLVCEVTDNQLQVPTFLQEKTQNSGVIPNAHCNTQTRPKPGVEFELGPWHCLWFDCRGGDHWSKMSIKYVVDPLMHVFTHFSFMQLGCLWNKMPLPFALNYQCNIRPRMCTAQRNLEMDGLGSYCHRCFLESFAERWLWMNKVNNLQER